MTSQRSGETRSMWASGLVVLAATLLLTSGLVQILQGIAAIANDDLFVATRSYAFELDITAWGWIHLIIGIILALTGFFLYTGQGWAHVVGMILAVLSLLTNFMFLPYYPLWAIVVITLDILVIWAISTFMAPPEAPDDRARTGTN